MTEEHYVTHILTLKETLYLDLYALYAPSEYLKKLKFWNAMTCFKNMIFIKTVVLLITIWLMTF